MGEGQKAYTRDSVFSVVSSLDRSLATHCRRPVLPASLAMATRKHRAILNPRPPCLPRFDSCYCRRTMFLFWLMPLCFEQYFATKNSCSNKGIKSRNAWVSIPQNRSYCRRSACKLRFPSSLSKKKNKKKKQWLVQVE